MSRPLIDQAERDLAARWTEGPLLVEAAAGTGKTRLLVDRVLHLVKEKKVPLRQIAAITFTNKAAAELRERIRARLQSERKQARERGEASAEVEAALGQIDGAPISTIHGFALALLRERPLDMGLPPGVGEIDLYGQEELRDRMWKDWLGERFAAGDPALGTCLELGFRVDQLAPLRDALLSFPGAYDAFPRPENLSAAALKERIGAAFRRWRTFSEKACGDWTDKAFLEIERVGRWAEGLTAESVPSLLRALWDPFHFNKRVGSPRLWQGKENLRAFRDGFDHFIESARAEVSHEILALLTGSFLNFASRYGRACRAEGLVGFDEMLAFAARLIRENPGARRHFRERFTHILVDEFQDTDPLQVEIVLLLAGEDPEERVWRKVRLRGGGLFLVGDPKQSIYRFRRADIAVYHEASRIVSKYGKVLRIRQNFRSAPGVIDWVNGVFSRLIVEDAARPSLQPGYLPLEPFRGEAGPRVRLLEDSVPPEGAPGEREEGARGAQEAGGEEFGPRHPADGGGGESRGVRKGGRDARIALWRHRGSLPGADGLARVRRRIPKSGDSVCLGKRPPLFRAHRGGGGGGRPSRCESSGRSARPGGRPPLSPLRLFGSGPSPLFLSPPIRGEPTSRLGPRAGRDRRIAHVAFGHGRARFAGGNLPPDRGVPLVPLCGGWRAPGGEPAQAP